MTPTEVRRAKAELELVRQRRELVFWTITMTVTVIVLAAMALAFIASLIHGQPIDSAKLATGTGVTGAGAASSHLIRLLRRSS